MGWRRCGFPLSRLVQIDRGRARAGRKKSGVTQEKLAIAIGQRQTFISKYELGERRLDIAEFVEICRAIGADPHKLLRAPEKSPAPRRRRAPNRV